MTIYYTWTLPTGETLRLRANLAEASAPIQYEADGSWYSTPYQSADARHRPAEALRLALVYLGPDFYRDPSDDRSDEEILDAIVAEAVRLSACGTRAVERHGPDDYRVACATCGAGGSVRHRTRESATRAAVRDSARPCRACGAR